MELIPGLRNRYIPVPMHHSVRRFAEYVWDERGVIAMASAKLAAGCACVVAILSSNQRRVFLSKRQSNEHKGELDMNSACYEEEINWDEKLDTAGS